jgi:hypothetical protein
MGLFSNKVTVELVEQWKARLAQIPAEKAALEERFTALALPAQLEEGNAAAEFAEVERRLSALELEERKLRAAIPPAERQLEQKRKADEAADRQRERERKKKALAPLLKKAAEADRHAELLAADLHSMREDISKAGADIDLAVLAENLIKRVGVAFLGANLIGQSYAQRPPRFHRNPAHHTEEFAREMQAELDAAFVQPVIAPLAAVIKSKIDRIYEWLDRPEEDEEVAPPPRRREPEVPASTLHPREELARQLARPWGPQHTKLLDPKDPRAAPPQRRTTKIVTDRSGVIDESTVDHLGRSINSPAPPPPDAEVQPPGPKLSAAQIQAGIPTKRIVIDTRR